MSHQGTAGPVLFATTNESLSHVKYIVKANCGRGFVGGGSLELWLVSRSYGTYRTKGTLSDPQIYKEYLFLT